MQVWQAAELRECRLAVRVGRSRAPRALPGRRVSVVASNVYRVNGTNKYLALIEAYDGTSNWRRYFRS